MPEKLLETLDLLAQRRLRDTQPFSRFAEVKRVGDSQEVPQVPQFDLLVHISII